VLLVGLGGTPEGLPAAMVDLTRRYAERLPPADVTRLLPVLAATEPQMRLGGNQRLLVELLLLRFAMLDRTVEIGEVLKALGGGGPSDHRTVGQERGGDTILRDSVPSPSLRRTVTPSDRPTVRPSDGQTVRQSDSPTPTKGPHSHEPH